MKPLTRAKLDSMGCGMPDCGHDHTVLYLHSRCHPASGVSAHYDKRTGTLTINCRSCKTFIAEIAVAA
jgi:hypothetical protein